MPHHRWGYRPAIRDGAAPVGPIRMPLPEFPDNAAPVQRAERYIAEIRRILAYFGRRRAIAKGAALCDPGDTSQRLYIVDRGSIDASLREDPARRPVASFHSGACLLFDFGANLIVALEASEESEVIDVPVPRLNRLCRQHMELRLLLRQCHAFNLKSFLEDCYPARERFRLVFTAEAGADRFGEATDPDVVRQPTAQFLLPLGQEAGPRVAGDSEQRRRHARRRRRRNNGAEQGADGDDERSTADTGSSDSVRQGDLTNSGP